ncbi:MAG: hypothetical protein CL840_17175 [Crocinitomicaceae bacterium]|nr:hypothetical protein [Crocinitomicaceae bacterium]|tara:strand:- start:5505 stop:6197 length:693 start_codon:yes stop_codon:yes gene_type:complete
MAFKQQVEAFLNKPHLHVATVILVLGLSALIGGIGYFFGMLVVLLTLWARNWDWGFFGIAEPNWKRAVVQGLLYSIAIFIFTEITVEPIIDRYFGDSDLSSFDNLKGNLANYIVFSLFMWVIAAFGEEMLYRGYMVKRIAIILGNKQWGWIAAITISSIIFGIAHKYQGPAGMVGTGVIGFLTGLIFLRNKNNLLVCMFTHGFYDMIGITLLYFGIQDMDGLIEAIKGSL